MTKTILIYGSTTGNTETLSEVVVEGLEQGGAEVTVKNVTEVSVNELEDYDLIVLGCSTWGEGELQDDFIDFYDEMKSVSLTGKKAAVFGPGDSEMYPDSFCEAVDMLEDKLKKSGAEIIIEGLKVDGDVEPVMEDARNWGIKVVESL
ncbi:MAG: flavodoxin [Candidatus Cloacimonetes bacterium]|nr:flavodoxin [Candidatus Cloacimonadota bacterium]